MTDIIRSGYPADFDPLFAAAGLIRPEFEWVDRLVLVPDSATEFIDVVGFDGERRSVPANPKIRREVVEVLHWYWT